MKFVWKKYALLLKQHLSSQGSLVHARSSLDKNKLLLCLKNQIILLHTTKTKFFKRKIIYKDTFESFYLVVAYSFTCYFVINLLVIFRVRSHLMTIKCFFLSSGVNFNLKKTLSFKEWRITLVAHLASWILPSHLAFRISTPATTTPPTRGARFAELCASSCAPS